MAANKETDIESFATICDLLSKYSSPVISMMKHASDVTFPFVSAAYRGAFLLNGAAAIAVLSKKESLDDIGRIIVSNGACGALAAVLASFFMYLYQYYNVKEDVIGLVRTIKEQLGGKGIKASTRDRIFKHIFGFLTCLSFFGSIYFFLKSLSSLVDLL